MKKNIFEEVVKNEFQYLHQKYGFAKPEIEDFGREVFVKFDRGAQTVSISLEHGSEPLIEIICPTSETGDKPEPWTSKDGIERSRRFPEINISSKFTENDKESISNYMKEISREFEEKEKNWLKA